MMNIDIAVRQLLPGARQPFDFLVQEREDGLHSIIYWNLPDPQPTPAELDAAWAAWEAGQPERDAKALEVTQAQPVAKGWFAGQQAAMDFVRLTPAQQATAIDGYSLTQLKAVVKYLAVAVSMLIKRELLP